VGHPGRPCASGRRAQARLRLRAAARRGQSHPQIAAGQRRHRDGGEAHRRRGAGALERRRASRRPGAGVVELKRHRLDAGKALTANSQRSVADVRLTLKDGGQRRGRIASIIRRTAPR
jgi:hypothetical protein